MKIDVNKIDKQMRMLEILREAAADPEMAALVEGVLSGRNGSSSVVRQSAAQQVSSPKPPATKHRFIRGALKQAVLEAVRRQTKPFTAYELTDGMLAEGVYKFTAANPPIAVNDVLRSLVKRKEEVKLHHKGKGGEAHKYVHVKPHTLDAATVRLSGD